MAILDFPPSPAIGTLYPNPAVQGQPQYTYDGEKWISGTGGGAIYISDSAPAAPAGSLWWESDTSILYVRYFDGDSTQWCQVLNGPADAVRFGGAQTLTAPQQVQARSNVYAAPFDALGWSGLQVNGTMEVSQERVGGTNIPAINSQYVVDGFRMYVVGPVVTARQAAGGPMGITTELYAFVTTAVVSLAATDYAVFHTSIEGYRTARLNWGTANAQPITIGFWTNIHRPGMYSGAVRNADDTRSYPFVFTHNVADTWEYKTVTVLGDTAGTWLLQSGIGMKIQFTMAQGTAYQGPPGAWASTLYQGATGTTNGVASTSDVFRLTGVVVLPGIEAPSAARSPFIVRPFDQELVTCQRYYQKSYDYAAALGTVSAVSGMSSAICDISGNLLFTNIVFKTRLRASPTAQLYSYNGAIAKWTKQTGNTDTATCSVALTGESGYPLLTASGLVSTAGYYGHWTADARL